MNLNAENLNARTTINGEVLLEPSYLQYLRENGHPIDELQEVHTVPSESEKGKAHLVVKVETTELPTDHQEADVVADAMDLWACDCWSYRTSTNDVAEGEYPPEGSCKHVLQVSREERAKNDEQQETL